MFKKIISWIQNNLLLQFALIAGLIFLLYSWVSPRSENTIAIPQETYSTLVGERRKLLGRPLTKTEQDILLSGYIDEEVILREAEKLDLVHKDGDVRQTLMDKMTALIVGEPPEPGEEELKDYLKANQSRLPSQLITFEQVFYESQGDSLQPKPQDILNKLRQGENFCQFGDPTLPIIQRVSQEQLSHDLGAEFAEQVFALKPREWFGPLQSGQGTHFVRVTEKISPSQASFSELESNLRTSWLMEQRRVRLEQKLPQLRQKYRLEVPRG